MLFFGFFAVRRSIQMVGRSLLRIPLKSASDSEANRPAVWSKAAGGRSAATLEFCHSLRVE